MCPINLDFGHKGKNNLEFLKQKFEQFIKIHEIQVS